MQQEKKNQSLNGAMLKSLPNGTASPFPQIKCFSSPGVICYTEGYYSGVQTCNVKHDLVNGEMIPKETWEHTITNCQKPSLRADSGCLVFERQWIKGKSNLTKFNMWLKYG